MQETGFIIAVEQIRVFSMVVRFIAVCGTTAQKARLLSMQPNRTAHQRRKQDGESAAAGKCLRFKFVSPNIWHRNNPGTTHPVQTKRADLSRAHPL